MRPDCGPPPGRSAAEREELNRLRERGAEPEPARMRRTLRDCPGHAAYPYRWSDRAVSRSRRYARTAPAWDVK
ncbi:hypothetical protein Asi03nite_57950 [Actinoplanes siamensis]|uniref:Uncharacterized protein n=1 Tax=Actinoplanes siamensis TaxID=1223317 RepID=A0A919TN14_9ACTN|nr:hypothetical protein Asi03nite_57950 [Actinoplanes siamensis]